VEHCYKKEVGESIPERVALDANGEPTTDPKAALEGTILPFDGPKGSGLAIAVEVLAGGLVGAAMGRNVTGTYQTEDPCTKGDLFIAIDPDSLAGGGFAERASMFLSDLKAEKTAAGIDEVRLPGEGTINRERTSKMITVEDDLWGNYPGFRRCLRAITVSGPAGWPDRLKLRYHASLNCEGHTTG